MNFPPQITPFVQKQLNLSGRRRHWGGKGKEEGKTPFQESASMVLGQQWALTWQFQNELWGKWETEKKGLKNKRKNICKSLWGQGTLAKGNKYRATVPFTARPTSLVTLLPVVINSHFLQLCVKQPVWKRASSRLLPTTQPMIICRLSREAKGCMDTMNKLPSQPSEDYRSPSNHLDLKSDLL